MRPLLLATTALIGVSLAVPAAWADGGKGGDVPSVPELGAAGGTGYQGKPGPKRTSDEMFELAGNFLPSHWNL